LEKARRQHTPVVLLDRCYEGADFPFVGVKNEEGAYLGTRHLIEGGYREIGILSGFQLLSTMRERVAGFRRALIEYQIDLPDEWIVDSPLSIESGRDAANKILSLPHRPKALFLNNNFLSLGTLYALKDLKLHCPEDIAIVGFDEQNWAAVSCSPLTTVCQPVRNLGQEAAKLIMEAINGQELDNRRIELDCDLIIRESSCPAHPC
jgi:LacI family transcriptional regulator